MSCPSRTPGSLRISLVEDDAETRSLLAQWISSAYGFVCCGEHASAEEAIERLPEEAPDVVITDINLPALSGIECVRRLKPLLPDTQFIMLTVYEDSEHLFDALAAGASGYLLKRTPCEDLLAAIREAHQGASPMTGSIARKVVQYFHATPNPEESAAEAGLSNREHAVLELLARGFLFKEIAAQLGISVLTVNSHVRRIYEKMHVRSRAQAVARFKGHDRPLQGRGRG
jgi:DNA-binding NarL/FixJ family response regulator